MNTQSDFFNLIKEKRNSKNFILELSNLLGLNHDAVYRRMRGSTALNFDEIMLLCQQYNVSFDSITNYSGSLIPFQFNQMFKEQFEIIEYLKNITEVLKSMGNESESKMVITAMDLPYFRQFGLKALRRFKLFFWKRSVLNIESIRYKKFDSTNSVGDYEELTEEIYSLYYNFPSIEIWAPETLDSTIKQIQYYYDSGLFESTEVALEICDDLSILLNTLEKEAEVGKKFIQIDGEQYSSEFQMYQSDIYLSNNCIQSFRKNKVFTYVSFNSFNYLMSFNPSFSNECSMWIEQIRSKSILLSEVSEKYRYQFFQSLRSRISNLKERIEQGSVL